MMKILTILGARPQFIKAAAFSARLAELKRSGKSSIKEKILHTGQHYNFELSEEIITQLEIPQPYLNLGVGSGNPGKVTAEMIAGIEEQLILDKPDWVLVYGDTNSTLAGSLAASKLHVKVCHIEAGLRSFNRQMPEEINRILTDHTSDLLFAPTQAAVKNLLTENIREGVYHVGDIMLDTSIRFGQIAEKKSEILNRLDLSEYYLTTIHRQENTDHREILSGILSAFDQIAISACPVIFPIHPRTNKILKQLNLCPQNPNVRIIPPVSYLDMIKLEKNAKIILTDSGGIQKEAYFHQIPCITIRNETEWIETVEAGWNQVAGVKTRDITDAVQKSGKGRAIKDYGDGDAAGKMIEIIRNYQ